MHYSDHTTTIPKIDIYGIWKQENTGFLTYDDVEGIAEQMGLAANPRISHDDLVDLTARVWDYDEVDEPFYDAMDRAAEAVYGQVRPDYVTPIGYAIVKFFSDRWDR